MIFVDSGAWYSSLIPTDPDHAAAQAWLAQNTEPLFTTDYIIEKLGLTTAFSFDHHFRQFGTVRIVP